MTAAGLTKPAHKDLFFIIKAGYSTHPMSISQNPTVHTKRVCDD